MKEIDGDIITLAKSGDYDVVIHGCNCFSKQGAGLAPQMAEAFHTDEFLMETNAFQYNLSYEYRHNKLGCIDFNYFSTYDMYVVNCYTQYHPGKNGDYQALIMCFKKLNHVFGNKDMKLLTPAIGCGIAGLDEMIVKGLVKKYLIGIDVTWVNYKI